jgi:hypothetical protein
MVFYEEGNMNELFYKGYIIEARPEKLVESGRWTTNIVIYKQQGGGLSDELFVAPNTFQTEEEATEHCFNCGKQIIDEK